MSGATTTTPHPPTPPLGPAHRTFLDQVAAAWFSAPEAVWLGAGGAALVQVVMTVRVADTEPNSVVAWCAGASAVACLALLVRRRQPLVATVVTGLAALLAAAGGTQAVTIPLLIAIDALVARGSLPARLAGVGSGALCLVGAGAVSPTSFSLTERVLPPLTTVIVVVAVAAIFRLRRESLEHEDAEHAARLQEQQARRQRDATREQARIAAELHDSVGHDLTAIIALAEGVSGSEGDPVVAEVIATINELAREGLADTRRAVSSLHPTAGPEGESAARPPGWDDLPGLLETVRQTGLAVVLTQTGARPDDPAVAELVFTVAREALTNVMRHGVSVSRVTVTLDHGGNGAPATTVTVLDDGAPTGYGIPRVEGTQPGEAAPLGDHATPGCTDEAGQGDGHGLAQLADRLAAAGGRLETGPTGTGWRLCAVVPGPGPATNWGGTR